MKGALQIEVECTGAPSNTKYMGKVSTPLTPSRSERSSGFQYVAPSFVGVDNMKVRVRRRTTVTTGRRLVNGVRVLHTGS